MTNQYIATKWDQINRNVDMFFTNQNSPQKNKSSIFIYSSFNKTEGQSVKSEYDFQLKFDLPNTTKKLKIVIEKQQDEISNALSDTSAPSAKAGSKNKRGLQKDDSHYTAGANYFLTQSKYLVSFIHFGIRLDMPLNPNIKLDLEKKFKLEKLDVSVGMLQKIIYYRQEGVQEISQLSFNKVLSENFQTDFVHSLVWTDENDDFLLRHNLVLYQDLGNEKGLSYSIGANARLSPSLYYDSYDSSISYRQLLYKDWLYGTLTVGATFPKVENFNDEKFVQVRLDLFFKEK